MKVSDMLPKGTFGKNQRICFYGSPGGVLIRSVHKTEVKADPQIAAGAMWNLEVENYDALSPEAFNIIVKLPEGRTHI